PSAVWELKLMSVAEIENALTPKGPASTFTAAAPKPADTAAAAPKPSVPPAAPPAAGRRTPTQANGRPSLRQAQQQAQQRGNGFQRVDVNQAGDLSAAGNEGAISNEMAADLSTSASDSLMVSGSVTGGLNMPGMADWGNRMEGMMM